MRFERSLIGKQFVGHKAILDHLPVLIQRAQNLEAQAALLLGKASRRVCAHGLIESGFLTRMGFIFNAEGKATHLFLRYVELTVLGLGNGAHKRALPLITKWVRNWRIWR